MATPYFVYILRCEDNSLYTGITTDIARRLRQHLGEQAGGAKCTRAHRPVAVERVWQTADRSSASRLEIRIKMLSKAQKEALVAAPALLNDYFSPLLDCNEYVLYTL